jgi:ABC-type sugar transport system substrate-binding protein
MATWKTASKAAALCTTAMLTIATLAGGANAQDADKKFKIYLSLSYSGNSWQSEAANIVKALAATPPYDKQVELIEVISGTDPQAQISAYESMIEAGADGIVSFPISSTALNRTIKRGCEEGVLFFSYDATVTEPCAYNVSYITSGFGENTAQALVNELGGKGKIFLSRGVPGNSVDKRHTDGAMHIFNQYPGIEVAAEYYSYWDDRTTQQETAKALAAHPDVDGIWAQAGEYGAIQALLDKGRRSRPSGRRELQRLPPGARQSGDAGEGPEGRLVRLAPGAVGLCVQADDGDPHRQARARADQHPVPAAVGAGRQGEALRGRHLRERLQHLPRRQGAVVVRDGSVQPGAAAGALARLGARGQADAGRDHPAAAGRGHQGSERAGHQLPELRAAGRSLQAHRRHRDGEALTHPAGGSGRPPLPCRDEERRWPDI